jgi:hypothetical protein
MTTEVVNPDSLWTLVEHMQALLDTRDGMDPQDPNFPSISAEIDAQIEAQIRKVSGIHAFRAHALAMAERCNLMQSTYLAARQSWERTVERLEEYVKSTMEHAGKKELEGDGLKIKLKANPPSVVITDENLIPWDYREVVQPPPVEKIVKAKIAKALKAGIDVPGADLNISSTRVDWGDPAKKKKSASPPAVDWDNMPKVKGETE